MLYAKIENNTPVEWGITEEQLREKLENISLPSPITPESIQELGWVEILPLRREEAPMPTKDKRVVMIAPICVDNVWKRGYELVDVNLPEDKYLERIAFEWKKVRAKRDALIEDTDWRISRNIRERDLSLPETENRIALQTYRQALADITNQEDPFTIIWPTL